MVRCHVETGTSKCLRLCSVSLDLEKWIKSYRWIPCSHCIGYFAFFHILRFFLCHG